MGQASTAPQPNDPFAASYNNLFGSGSGPSSQPSGQQFMNHPTAPQSYADMPQYQQQQPAQSHNPFAAMGDQPSGSPSFASSGEHNLCHDSRIQGAWLHQPSPLYSRVCFGMSAPPALHAYALDAQTFQFLPTTKR